MKKDQIEVGATYSARVGSRTADVRIDGVNAKGGWNATAVNSGKPVRNKDARTLRGPASADGQRTVDSDDADGGAAGAGRRGVGQRGGPAAAIERANAPSPP